MSLNLSPRREAVGVGKCLQKLPLSLKLSSTCLPPCAAQLLSVSNVGQRMVSIEDPGDVVTRAQCPLSFFMPVRGPPECSLAYLLCRGKRLSFHLYLQRVNVEYFFPPH